TASVPSAGESCLVRILSASVPASMRQISFAAAAAAAGVAVVPIAPPTAAAAPAATMNSRRDTSCPALHFSVIGFPPHRGFAAKPTEQNADPLFRIQRDSVWDFLTGGTLI